jgi:hypothetical protein
LITTGAQLQVPQLDSFFAFLDQHPAHRSEVLALALPQHTTPDYLRRALRSGMAPDASIAVDDATSLSLPCYLAHKRQLPLLLRLLREGLLSLPACGASVDDLWPHLQLAEDEVPLLCDVLEQATRETAQSLDPENQKKLLSDLPSPAFAQWLRAHHSLQGPLSDALSAGHPRLAGVLAEALEQALAERAAQDEARALEDLVASLCRQSAAEARAYLRDRRSPAQLVRVAVHHGLLDLVHGFVAREGGKATAPAWTPPTEHRLAADDAVNAWLWLLKGDGDLDRKAWLAMLASDLLQSDLEACDVIEGVCRSGAKVTTKAVLAGVTASSIPLQTAVAHDRVRAVESLLAVGADVARHTGAESLLRQSKSPEAARLLLEHKAGLYVNDSRGVPTGNIDYDASRSRAVWTYLRAVDVSRTSKE